MGLTQVPVAVLAGCAVAGAALAGCATATPARGYQPAPYGVVVTWQTGTQVTAANQAEQLTTCGLPAATAQTPSAGIAVKSIVPVPGDRLSDTVASCLTSTDLVAGLYLPRTRPQL